MPSALGRKVHEVATRVLSDPAFANEVRQAALRAVKGGSSSPDFKAYFELFASSPGELAEMGSVDAAGCTCGSNTWFTFSSLAGPMYTCCATTTTTTNSGNFFGE